MNLAYYNHITGGDSEKVFDSPKTNRTPDPGGTSFAEMLDEMVNRVAERGLTPVVFQTANHADLKVDDFKTRRKGRYSCFDNKDTYSRSRGLHRSRAGVYSSVYRDDRLVAVMDRATVTEKQKDAAGPIIDHNDYIVLEDL